MPSGSAGPRSETLTSIEFQYEDAACTQIELTKPVRSCSLHYADEHTLFSPPNQRAFALTCFSTGWRVLSSAPKADSMPTMAPLQKRQTVMRWLFCESGCITIRHQTVRQFYLADKCRQSTPHVNPTKTAEKATKRTACIVYLPLTISGARPAKLMVSANAPTCVSTTTVCQLHDDLLSPSAFTETPVHINSPCMSIAAGWEHISSR